MKKKISSALIVFFLLNLFQFNFSETVYADTPIIGQATASVTKMKEWAKSKGATETFIGLAPIYVNEANKHGGINPVIAYAQSAIETGYGKFGGIINESYHNPCGLKTKEGGADNDPNAHQKFKNWNDGVTAHLDHLALYAGANGYPRKDTTDPRHFGYLVGTAGNSVVGLSGKWAPSDKTYSDKILKLTNEIEKMQVVDEEPKLVIDSPKQNSTYKNLMEVSGWSLDDSGIKDVKVYIDNTYIKNVEYGKPRLDIFNSYPLYENKNSGFSGEIDLSAVKTGNHKVKVEILSNDGDKKSLSRDITIKREKAITCIDSPKDNSSYKNDLNIGGWALNDSGMKSVKAYIDNKFIKDLDYGSSRPDVLNAYPDYKNSKSGYNGKLDISGLGSGNHTLKVEAIGNDGSKKESYKTFKVVRNVPKIFIDSPKTGTKVEDKLQVGGWALNDSGIKEIKAYIDGKSVTTLKYGSKREDVYKAFPEYDNKNSGYIGEISMNNISEGDHTLKIEALGNDGSKAEASVKFKNNKKKSMVYIDYPSNGKQLIDKIDIGGWAIGHNKVEKVEAFINDKSIGELKYGYDRADVAKAYPDYKDIKYSGYKGTLNISDFSAGKYKLKVKATGVDGSVGVAEKDIEICKKKTLIALDNPSSSIELKDELTVGGWALDPDEVKEVNIYLDNKFLGKADYGIKRQDVGKAYSDYPNAVNSGYSAKFNLNNFAQGNHNLKVETVSKKGTKFSVQRTIKIKRSNPITCIDSPNDNFVTNSTLSIGGWGLNDSGINKINVYVDNQFVGNLNNTIKRNDVAKAYPTYLNNYNQGFLGSVDLNKVAPGKRTLKVEIIGKDGTKSSATRSIYIQKKQQHMMIDSPKENSSNEGKFKVQGWAINDSGMSKIKVYVDDKYQKDATKGIKREDVDKAYPGYRDGANSGYSSELDFTKVKPGKHKIKVEAIGNDGTTNSQTVTINRTGGKTIVIDPGHTINGGPDGGSISYHNGVKYDEGQLDMQLSMKLKNDLENKGYNVVMTQTPTSLIYASSVIESLERRVNVAELYNADLFISVHHNNYDSSSAYGSEVWYSDPKDSSIKPQYGSASEGKSIAGKLASTLASSGGYYNRGSKNGRLYVTRMTTMPSVLLEAGFISNPNDAKKAASSSNQSKIAQGLANKVYEIMK